MIRKIHYRIVDKIAYELKLSLEQRDLLRKGSILPDKWRDFPHHSGKFRDIRHRILRARKKWICGEIEEAMIELGVAMHYIIDSQGLPSSHRSHNAFEQNMLKYPITAQILKIPQGKKQTLDVGTRVIKFSDRLGRRRYTSRGALNAAYVLCYMVTKSVLSDPNPPPNSSTKLKDSWNNLTAHPKRNKLLVLGFWGAPLVFAASLFLGIQERFVISVAGAIVGVLGCLIHLWISMNLLSPQPSVNSQIVALCKLYHRLAYSIGIWVILGLLGLVVKLYYMLVGILPGLIACLLRWELGRSIHPDIRDNYDWYRWDSVEHIS